MNVSTASHLTDGFILHQDTEQSAVEIWLDWNPAVDDDPQREVRVWREGNYLLIQTEGVDLPRRLENLNDATWNGITTQGGVIVLCGPSGELGRRAFRLEAATN
jgi:hypothetical protein